MKKLGSLFLFAMIIGAWFFGSSSDFFVEGYQFTWYNIFIIFIFLLYREFREHEEKRIYEKWNEEEERIRAEYREQIKRLEAENKLLKEKLNK